MKVVLASDHAGFDYKLEIQKYLQSKGIITIDVGTYSKDSCDYPIFAHKAAVLVAEKEVDYGILFCSTGTGVSIVANKVKGIRCGVGYSDEATELMKKHNHANMISFGQSQIPLEDVLKRVKIFLETKPEGGRHERRVAEIE